LVAAGAFRVIHCGIGDGDQIVDRLAAEDRDGLQRKAGDSTLAVMPNGMAATAFRTASATR